MISDTGEFVADVLRDLGELLRAPVATLTGMEIVALGERGDELCVLADRMARMGRLCQRCGHERGQHGAGSLECPPPEGWAASTRTWTPGQCYVAAADDTDGDILRRRLTELGVMG